MQQQQDRFENFDPAVVTICCVPGGCHVDEFIPLDDLSDAVKIICNYENCIEGEYMHKACFEQWQESVLTYLRNTGRARSWNEKQRLQNLWTKKGYDLAYKACSCKCGKGHLRKDINWIPPAPRLGTKKKRHRKKKNDKPTLIVNSNAQPVRPITRPSYQPFLPENQPVMPPPSQSAIPSRQLAMASIQSINAVESFQVNPMESFPVNPARRSSVESISTASASPPNVSPLNISCPTYLSSMPIINNYLNTDFSSMRYANRHNREALKNLVRSERASYCVFSQRLDYSSFNSLPPNKLNSYHIKTDSETDIYDERDFILPALSARKIYRVHCIFCSSSMNVYDRYPLVDGTLFFSPQFYAQTSIPMFFNRKDQYLNAICMACLEGWTATLYCRFCQKPWNGSDLILGTVYSYDVIVALLCCEDRLTCKNCNMVLPMQSMPFFSDFSRVIVCPNCYVEDYHLIKPVSTYMLKKHTR